jgi:hypothetical protein
MFTYVKLYDTSEKWWLAASPHEMIFQVKASPLCNARGLAAGAAGERLALTETSLESKR